MGFSLYYFWEWYARLTIATKIVFSFPPTFPATTLNHCPIAVFNVVIKLYFS